MSNKKAEWILPILKHPKMLHSVVEQSLSPLNNSSVSWKQHGSVKLGEDNTKSVLIHRRNKIRYDIDNH